MAASVVDYEFIARPNCSLSRNGMVAACLAALSLSIAIAFGMAGAWMVFPFAGLESMALAYAFYMIHRHVGDYESITIVGDRLAVEKHDYKETSQVVFHRYWARAILCGAKGGEQRLWLRSHGREVEFGHYMSSEQRQSLARQLQERTGATC